MALPVMSPERRRSPRISLAALAYITFESNCGGIVLNISDDGLCFHTIAPVEPNDTVRFWFSAGGRQIEANGQLVWTDETRKTGGLRFNALSTEARRQIRKWIAESSEAFAAPRQAPAVRPPTRGVPSSANQAQKSVAHGSATRSEVPQRIGTPARWGEFSRGLATGILIAVIVAAIFLFDTYKHRIGESLIFLGERFAATPHSQQTSLAPAPGSASSQAAGPAVQQHVTAPPAASAATLASGSQQALIQPPTKAVKPTQTKPSPQPITPAIAFAPSTEAWPLIDFAAVRPSPPPLEPGGIAQPESTDRSADKTTV
ncbi:MAG TPA: PilZ domain-containing protein, partial [Candidatus Acidoferrales bacterium]